ncbi:uncharacterized protein [Panulirus ornatus]|uniref:uncharacterized protein n=1 Tax=Panulirus ornatus TaxID=150431 RepID=UPI003A87DA86
MGYFTSVSSLTVLWLMLAAGVGVVSLPAVKPYSGPGDDCRCVPYNHFCSLEVLPLTVVGAYSFAPYICPLRSRLCCLEETPPEINQIQYEEPLILANTDSLFFKDPASQFHRARQLLYNSDVQVTHDKPETTANEEIQLEDTYRHKAGNMAEDVKLSDVQEVEGQFLDTIVNQENVHEEKQISEKYINYGLGDSVILEDGASHTATETLETSLGFSEGDKVYRTTLMQESSHMTERDMALIQDDTQAVMVVHGTSHITDALRTSTEDDSAVHDSLMKEKDKETTEGTDVDDSGITHAFSEGGTSSQVATIHDASTLMTTVDPVDAMQSFHNETPERTNGSEPSPTVTRDDSLLYVFATPETSLQNDSFSRPVVSSPGGSDVTMNTDNDTKNVGSLTIDSDIKELHSGQSFPEFHNFTSSSSRTTQMPPKVNGSKTTTQVVYDYTVTPNPSVTNKVDYAKIVELAEAIISQNHKTLSDLQYSGSTTQPGQSTTVIHYVANVNEKAVEEYSDLHKQLSIQGLDGVYSEAISTVSQEVKNFHHENSRDPTHEHEQEVLFTQLDHGNNCSRNQCGNNTLVAQEPDLVNQSSVSVNPSSASHTDRPETLSYLENYSNEFFETSLVFEPPTTANLIIGSDTTIPSSTDEPALWYWFFA